MGEDVVDFLDVLGAERVLVFALGKLGVGIDEEDFVAEFVRLVFVQDENAGWDAGAIKEFGRKADDGLDDVALHTFLSTQEAPCESPFPCRLGRGRRGA